MYILTNAKTPAPRYFSTFNECYYTFDKNKAHKFESLKAACQFAVVNDMFVMKV